ncbi:hypothetical protein BKA69DRAFT_1054958 [Paraphysoderma sedebokerense]|nr:hypothetical protein BKA69DRAFT_1058422 [Paraphysoderma sedebokerense]KAI9144422.1 hypothetical protein BKA69DRAFT_1054958 [Paraphysoderma sedebokerense]
MGNYFYCLTPLFTILLQRNLGSDHHNDYSIRVEFCKSRLSILWWTARNHDNQTKIFLGSIRQEDRLNSARTSTIFREMTASITEPEHLAHFTSSVSHSGTHIRPVYVIPISGKDYDGAVVSVQGDGIYFYDIDGIKRIKAWTIPHHLTLACGAVYHSSSSSVLVAVQSSIDMETSLFGKQLWCWSDEGDLSSKKMSSLDQPIHRLLAPEELNSHVVVAHTNGSISLSRTDDLSVSASMQADERHQIQYVSCFVEKHADKEQIVFCILVTSDVNGDFHISLVAIMEEGNSAQIRRVWKEQVPREKYGQKPLKVSYEAELRHLSVLYSNGRFRTFKFKVNMDPSICHLMPLQSRHLFKRFGVDMSTIAISTIPYYVIFYGRSPDKSHFKVSVWDCKFGTCQHVLDIPCHQLQEIADPPTDKFVDVVPVPHSENLIFTLSTLLSSTSRSKSSNVNKTSKSAILRSRMLVPPVTLQSVLGKMPPVMSTNPNKLIPPIASSDVPALSATSEPEFLKGWADSITNQHTMEMTLMRKLNEIHDNKVYEKEFFAGLQHLLTQNGIEADEHGMEVDNEESLAKPTKLPSLSYTFVYNVVSRCFKSSEIITSVLEYLLSFSVVSNTMLPDGLITELIKRKDLTLLDKVLKHVIDIPEPHIILYLQHLIGHVSSLSKIDFQTYLTSIMQYPHTDIFLRESMKSLSSDQVSILLGVFNEFLGIILAGSRKY